MKKLLLLFIILVPTFFRLIRPGIYTMQDFPYFRLVEYHTCMVDLQIPCRWAPHAGLGFGEPVFNFYSHVPFFTGTLFMDLGFSGITSLKILFGLSLFLSGAGMFLLSKKVWKNSYSAYISAILYVYAPYRAVNVWVRGALPEAFAFIFIPFILLAFEHYKDTKKIKWLVCFSILISLLILTHNLSVLLFAPVIVVFILTRLFTSRRLKLLTPLIIASLISLLLSAFYLLPAVLESPLVNLQTTTQGYFDFRAHFVTIPQLLFSRFWGYGGSTWGDQDGLSLAIGQVQWLLAALLGIVSLVRLFRRKRDGESTLVVVLIAMSVFGLFLTHNKSAFVWVSFSSVMKYIQFPWRFLGTTLFSISLAAGAMPSIWKRHVKILTVVIIAITILLNSAFYKEDIWRNVSDNTLQTGSEWIEQSRASIGDYWPQYGSIPLDYARPNIGVTELAHTSNGASYSVVTAAAETVSLPVAFYPGWTAQVNENFVTVTHDTAGMISIPVQKGASTIRISLESTSIQKLGNTISLITSIVLLLLFGITTQKKKR